MFHHCTAVRNPGFLTTPLQAYENVSADAQLDWDRKTINKLFWRGTSTGDSYTNTGKKDGDWRRSHRPRLHLLAQKQEGDREIYVERKSGWGKETWRNAELNEKYMDVGLTGKPHQVGGDVRLWPDGIGELRTVDSVGRRMGRAMRWHRRLCLNRG